MKIFILFAILGLSSAPGCKAKQDAPVQKTTPLGAVLGTVQGKVSHQYRKTGCATVIVVHSENPEEVLVLIPKDTLSPEFDKDELEIVFNYRKLRIPNPKGCTVGIPAEIKDISKK